MADYKEFLQVAVAAARMAGERILQDFGGAVSSVQKTDPSDLVTKADADSQQIIENHIKNAFPDHGFLGEESEGKHIDAEYRWVVDPIDGTSNFIQGMESMGVSIAVQHRGESVVGVIYFPALNKTYHAIKDKGAFCNDEPVSIRDCARLEEAYVTEIFSDRTHRNSQVLYPKCRAYRRFGSAVTSCAYLAGGNVHATALHCHEWDIAAAEVLITEAGGRVEVFRSADGDPAKPLAFIAAVPGIFDDFRQEIIDKYYTDLASDG